MPELLSRRLDNHSGSFAGFTFLQASTTFKINANIVHYDSHFLRPKYHLTGKCSKGWKNVIPIVVDASLITNQLPGRTLITASAEYLYFSGASYLGMSRNEVFRENLAACFRDYGTNYSSSRLSNVQLKIFGETEAYLAAWTGAEAALTVSSGLVAGQLVIQALARTGSFFYGPRTHPALWRQPADFSAVDYTTWGQTLPDTIRIARGKEIIVVTNSLDVLWAQPYDLRWIGQLPENKKITVVIDDSHGFGITGENGAGIYSELKKLPTPGQIIVVSSFGKALGIPGGVILGNRTFIDQLQRQAFFGGGSPPVPAYLAAFLKSEVLYRQARKTLKDTIRYFTSCLPEPAMFQSFPDYPVFYTPQNGLYPFLLDRQILISHFPYPSPADLPITRVVLNSLHTTTDIDTLVQQIKAFNCSGKLQA